MSADPVPPMAPPRLIGPREFIGTGENRVEVTGKTDREILLNIGTMVVDTHASLGSIAAELADLRRVDKAHEARLDDLEDSTESSYQDLGGKLREVRDTLKARIKDPRDDMTSERARAIAEEAFAAARNKEKADKLDKQDEAKQKAKDERRNQIIIGIVLLILSLLGSGLVGHLEGRATAPAMELKK